MKPIAWAGRLSLAVAAAAVALTSQVTLAHPVTSRFDSCFQDCGAGGACEAHTRWWEFWDDCHCSCTSSGTASCYCA